MSLENIEIVRRAIHANRSGPPEDTVEEGVALTDPNLVYTSRLTSVEGSTYRGHEGLRAFFADMGDAWREWRNEVNEVTAVAPNAVLTHVIFRGTGYSGVDVELRSAVVCVLSDCRIVEIHAYPSREQALQAAGVAE